MNKLTFPFLLIFTATCFAGGHPAFTPMPQEYLSTSGQIIEVRNMPKVRNQGGLPVCDGYAAWYLLMQYQCKRAGSDCKSLEPGAVPHPVLFASLGATSSYSGKYGRTTVLYSEGSATYSALNELQSTGKALADSCFNYEQLVYSKYHGDQVSMAKAFESLKANYFDQFKSTGKVCMDCLLTTLQQNFDLTVDATTAEKALNEKIFDQFLYDVMYGQCRTKAKMPFAFENRGWPNDNESASYDGFIKKLAGIFGTNTPVAVGACLDEQPPTDHCKSAHGMAIAGYRKVCNGGRCSEYIKVHNSWGKEWQDRNSKGWIDARNFYEYMQKSKNSMTWIEAEQ